MGCDNQGFKAIDSENHQRLTRMWRLSDTIPELARQRQEDQPKSEASQTAEWVSGHPVKATEQEHVSKYQTKPIGAGKKAHGENTCQTKHEDWTGAR